jgi:hypothetical protein
VKTRQSRKYSGNNRRGRARVPERAHPAVKVFVTEMNAQEKTFYEVSRFSGVAVDTLRFWGFRHMPRVDLLDAALDVLGYELCVREKNYAKR